MTKNLVVGICGAGAMGSGIALVAAQSGARVIVFDVSEASCAKSRELTASSLRQSIERGRLSKEDGDAVLASMSWTGSLNDLANCQLVVEAIIEDADIKQQLFGQLEAVLASDAIIASNTSSLSIARLAKALDHPERFVGMHFFNPATAMKLVEVVSGPATAPEAAQRVTGIATSWKKVAVPVADVAGFIVNRVARPYYAEAFQALQQSAAPAEVIDQLFKAAAGFRMGPLELTDLIGQDINFSVASSVYEAYYGQTRFVPQGLQRSLVDAGWFGRKSGRGVYDYAGSATMPVPVPVEVDILLEAPAKPDATEFGSFSCEVSGVLVRFTRGRTAKEEALIAGTPVALLDWFETVGATACGFSASDAAAAKICAALLFTWGLAPFQIADRPGLIIARVLAQISNASGDAVLEGVSNEDGIDSALRFGANYPFGPFAWADWIGREQLVSLLQAIAHGTGRPMYNPSEYWMDGK